MVNNTFHGETYLVLPVIPSGLQQAHIENADKAAYKEANNKVEHDDPHFQKYVSR